MPRQRDGLVQRPAPCVASYIPERWPCILLSLAVSRVGVAAGPSTFRFSVKARPCSAIPRLSSEGWYKSNIVTLGAHDLDQLRHHCHPTSGAAVGRSTIHARCDLRSWHPLPDSESPSDSNPGCGRETHRPLPTDRGGSVDSGIRRSARQQNPAWRRSCEPIAGR